MSSVLDGIYLKDEPCKVKAEAKSHKVDCIIEACAFFVTKVRFGWL